MNTLTPTGGHTCWGTPKNLHPYTHTAVGQTSIRPSFQTDSSTRTLVIRWYVPASVWRGIRVGVSHQEIQLIGVRSPQNDIELPGVYSPQTNIKSAAPIMRKKKGKEGPPVQINPE